MNNGKQKFTYQAEMINGERVEFTIESANDTEKKTYLKHFVEVNRDQNVYFVDNLSGEEYNKLHILKYKEKGVKNG